MPRSGRNHSRDHNDQNDDKDGYARSAHKRAVGTFT